MRIFLRLLLAAFLLFFASPIVAHAQSDGSSLETATDSTKPVAKSAKKTTTKAPVSVSLGTSSPTAAISTSAPGVVPAGTSALPAPQSVEKNSAKEAGPEKSEAKTVSVKAGKLDISHANAVAKGDDIDIFLSIKNGDKIPEVLASAETSIDNDGVVFITKGKDGKETEVPSFSLDGDKTSDLSSGGTWLRIKNVKKMPKGTLPLDLHFRRSPNAHLSVEMKAKASSLLGGFFGQ